VELAWTRWQRHVDRPQRTASGEYRVVVCRPAGPVAGSHSL